MTTVQFNFNKANRFLPHIILVGLGIGTANFIIYDNLNWIQWCIQSLSTSFIIGYILVVIGTNKSWLKSHFQSKLKLYLLITICFFLTGVIATEVEQVIKSLIFNNQEFHFLSAEEMYLYNGIISLILGISFFENNYNKVQKSDPIENDNTRLDFEEAITQLPLKQGENTLLMPIKDVIYFEAYDNYSFVYDLKGGKRLCDYSLLFLQKRLGKQFSRIHRKYIVNTDHIQQIKPHLNGRFLIQFSDKVAPITSSKSYSTIIRKLIKIE